MLMASKKDPLSVTHPEIAAQADGWDPSTVSIFSNKSFAWKCRLGHSWVERVHHRTEGSGCPYCSGQRVLVGFNDLATLNPELAAQADGWDPSTVTAWSKKKLAWQCQTGHRWKAEVGSRSRGNGCSACSLSGFNPAKPGWLYLVFHDGWDMFQIGISNKPEDRLSTHYRTGFREVLDLRGPMDGYLAQQLETAILHSVERRGGVLGHKAQIEKFDGYSEAWTKDSLTVKSFKQLLDWVYEDE